MLFIRLAVAIQFIGVALLGRILLAGCPLGRLAGQWASRDTVLVVHATDEDACEWLRYPLLTGTVSDAVNCR
jgi:hypothetical protein